MVSEAKSATHHKIRDSIILVLTGLLLLLAQSAFWLNHTIFDKQTFTSTVTPVIQSDASHQAIASTITSQILADNPVVERLIGKNVTALIMGILGTDLGQQLQSNLIDRSYAYLTTDNPKPIAINLEPIKVPLEKVTQVLESRGTDVTIDASKIPDTIVLFNPSNLPDLYSYGVAMLWLGPLFWLSFLVLSVLYVYLGRHNYPRRVYILGGVIITASIIGLFVGPTLVPPIVAQVPMSELRGIVNQLMNELLASFTTQNVIAITITGIAMTIFYSRHAITKGTHWAVQKTSDVNTDSKTPSRTKK